jgi:hypothetical protein
MTSKGVAIGFVIGVSCFGAGLWAQGRTVGIPGGQIEEDRYKVLGHQFTVFSGDDVGIRLTGQEDTTGRVPGTLVVRINGRWVDVATPSTLTNPGR